MRKPSLNELIALFIFFLIATATVLVVKPVYKKMNRMISAFTSNVCLEIQQKTGLQVSYEALSPSVFTGLRVKNIVFSNSEDGSNVAKISSAIFRYNFFDILRGKGISFIKDLSIDGLYFDFDEERDTVLFERFSNFLKVKKNVKKEHKKKINMKDLEDIISSAPFNIFIKNVHLRYNGTDISFDADLKRLVFNFVKNNNQTTVKTQGTVYMKNKERIVSGIFSADGIIPEQLDGLSIMFRFSECKYDIYELNRLSFLVDYGNRVLNFRTVQNSFPLFISGFYNLESKDSSLFVRTQELKGKNFISQKNNKDSGKYKNIAVSMGLDAGFNFNTKKLRYQSSGSIKIPSEIIDNGAVVNYALHGTDKNIEIKEISARGKNIDMDFHGSCVYKGLKVSGALDLRKMVLHNGKNISTEVYIDPGKTGFMAFAPQLILGSKTLTALQLDVMPSDKDIFYTFELSDYDHMESDGPGILKLDGSLSSDYKEINCNVSSDKIYLDSLAKTVNFFNKKSKENEYAFLKKYILTADFFVSFKSSEDSLTCNVPYAVIANTEKDDQFIYFSADGTRYSMNISRLDYISDGKLVHASGYMNTSDFKEASFGFDLLAGTVPYSFSGNYISGSVSVIGDYGFTFVMQNDKDSGNISGSFLTDNLPVSAADTIFSFASDCDFSYTCEKGVDVRINRVECHEAGEKYVYKPKIAFTGFANRYGIFMENLYYSDKYSILEGKSNLLWNFNEKKFSSVNFDFNMKNPVSAESMQVSMELNNTENVDFNIQNLKEKFYISAQASVNTLGMNRFTAEQSPNNELTASLAVTGTLKEPYIGLEIQSLSLMKAGNTAEFSGSAFVEEKNLIIEKAGLHYNQMEVKNISAELNLDSFTGSATADIDIAALKKNVHIPVKITLSDTVRKKGNIIPAEYAVDFLCESISGSLITKTFPLKVSVLHTSDATFISTGEEQGISGTIVDGEFVNFSVAERKPVQFNLTGNISENKLDLKFSDVKVELAKLLNYIDIPYLKVFSGVIRSSIHIGGLKSDPDFSGSISIENGDFILPRIVTQHITFPKALMVLNHNRLEMPDIRAVVKKEFPLFANLAVQFERWKFSYLDSHIWTPEKSYIPGNFEIRLAKFIGQTGLDLNLHFEDSYLDVAGKVNLKNMSINVNTKEIPNAPPKRKVFVRSDLKIGFGQHVTLFIEPLIRAVLIPDSGFGFKYDMSERTVALDGDLQLRSGDISYLSRSFYLKNGTLKFNNNDFEFNPLISVQAETRERDDDGKDIRIILSAQNQYLSDFNPKFSSIPSKSEVEIMAMLGQIAVGDSNNVTGLLFAAGDYAIQSTIGRSIENKLREFLNFDILSVRTNVLQNALNYNFNKNNQDSSYKIGNFFDNSTVYLGKYLGRSLYVDTLMHLSYDGSRVDDKYTFDGLIFKPEIGLEIESPFVNVRWNMAPDLSGLRSDSFVYSTSVTLSWKFSF